MASADCCPYCGQPVTRGPSVQTITWGLTSCQWRRVHRDCHSKALEAVRRAARERWAKVGF